MSISILCPKISNPSEIVEVIHEDGGCEIPLYTVSGGRIDAYVTRIQIRQKDGSYVKDFVYVAKDACSLDEMLEFRLKEDIKVLKNHDIDLISGIKKKWPIYGADEFFKRLED